MFSLYANNIGIDLGTANTIVYSENKGIILNQPSVVSIHKEKGEDVPYMFGNEAKMMLGRTPNNIKAMRPLKGGVIADFHAAAEMIKYFIKKSNKNWSIFGPIIVICVPYGSTQVEKHAIQDAAESAGARDVYLIEEPIAAAIGAGLPVNEPRGSMIVDIGGGTTEVAALSLNGIAQAKSIRVGGDNMDEGIISYVRRNIGLNIGEATAEEIKKTIGCAISNDSSEVNHMTIRGLDIINGTINESHITEEQIAESLKDSLLQIVEAIKSVLELTPPELVSDIFESGITLSGGGALLNNLSAFISKEMSKEMKLDVHIAENPLECVAYGTGIALENRNDFRHVIFKQK